MQALRLKIIAEMMLSWNKSDIKRIDIKLLKTKHRNAIDYRRRNAVGLV